MAYNGFEGLIAEMARQRVLEAWLAKFSPERRAEIEQKIRSAPTIKYAFQELKKLRYKGSYDSVHFWRGKDKGSVEGVGQQATEVSQIAASLNSSRNPVDAAMDLANRLNSLCMTLTALLEQHEWVEPGEVRLSGREAAKLLAVLPTLARASSGTLIEMSQIRVKTDEKLLALGILGELREDWRRTLEGDNPELIPLLESVEKVTISRLQLDEVSLLENYWRQHEQEACMQADESA